MSDLTWKEFSFVDVFDIKKGFYNKKPPCHTSGNVPFIGASDSNNGITGFTTYSDIKASSKVGYGPNEPFEKKIFPGHAICVTNNGSVGYAYYVESDFTCTHDVNPLYLHNRELNRYIALFLIACIEKQRVCFEYARKWRPMRMIKSKLLLPVSDGEIAWDFMESYMRKKETEILKPTIDKLCIRLIHNDITGGGNSIHPHWRSFQLSDLFVILPGKRLTKSEMTEGHRPFIGASDSNNGITAWVGNSNESLDFNVLGVNYNGSVCETFYHPYECVFSDDVKRLHLREGVDSKYIYLFLKVVILQQKCKYEYGYKFNEQRMMRQSIVLPVDELGNPDWFFMERFMRKLETKMLETTIEIFKKRVNVNKCKSGGVKWKAISLLSLFEFTKGNQNNMASLHGGDIPLVSARKCDNGYKCFVSPNAKPLFQGDILTLNLDGDGGAGLSYYQPATMALDTHVGALKPRFPMTHYQMLFLSTMLTHQGDMFGHGYSINSNRVRSIKIMIPMNDKDEIDFGYMDSYMRQIETSQILSYLNHVHSYYAGLPPRFH